MEDIINIVKSTPKLVGFKQVTAGIIQGTIRCVLVSDDCDEFIKNAIAGYAADYGVELICKYSMKQLGKMCGIDVKASVVGLLKESNK